MDGLGARAVTVNGGTRGVCEQGGPGRSVVSGSELPAPRTSDIAKPCGRASTITVLDWAGFSAALSYTFDDANSSQIEHYHHLQRLGVPMTFYLHMGKPEAADGIWSQALEDGHELGNHTMSHMNVGAGDLAADTDTATKAMQERFGVFPWTMAAPYGAPEYARIAESRFLINRGVHDALILPCGSNDPYDLNCFVPAKGAPAMDLCRKIECARTGRGWQVILIHGFEGGADHAYQPVSIEAFTAGVEFAKSFGDIWIGTVADIGAYWRAQIAFSKARITTLGDETTWRWTLPTSYPPGRHLRVTVEGGTLTQEGAVLTWDAHGYYEISLDAGTVTLRP